MIHLCNRVTNWIIYKLGKKEPYMSCLCNHVNNWIICKLREKELYEIVRVIVKHELSVLSSNLKIL